MHKAELTLTLAQFPAVQRDRRLTRRGADTREKILDATLACIVRSGFAAMTVENVMTEAGTSRGSILHQFPTRIALAVAATDRAAQVMMDAARAMAARIKDPYTRLTEYAQIVWDTHALPEGLAMTDILLAARWDAELSAGIQPIIAAAENRIAAGLVALATAAGIENPSAIAPRGLLLVSCARGLVIETSLGFNRPMIVEAIAEMVLSHRRYCDALHRVSGGQPV